MHRVVIATVGERRLHLLKLAGAFIIFGSALGVLDSISWMFRIVKQIEAINVNPELSLTFFQLPAKAVTGDVILGLFMMPSAMLLLWLALFCVGAMIYRTGEIIIPVEKNK